MAMRPKPPTLGPGPSSATCEGRRSVSAPGVLALDPRNWGCTPPEFSMVPAIYGKMIFRNCIRYDMAMFWVDPFRIHWCKS